MRDLGWVQTTGKKETGWAGERGREVRREIMRERERERARGKQRERERERERLRERGECDRGGERGRETKYRGNVNNVKSVKTLPPEP